MTTPQSQLHTLSQRIWDLWELFQPKDEEKDSIFDRVKQIEFQQMDIMTAQQRIENQMILIIKLLRKNEA
jgi:hypothetical protein